MRSSRLAPAERPVSIIAQFCHYHTNFYSYRGQKSATTVTVTFPLSRNTRMTRRANAPPGVTEILFMGAKGSGKSLLLRRLQTLSGEKRLTPFDAIPGTKPTEGTDALNFKFRGTSFVFRELGGASIRGWESHATTPKAIVYVFDGADLTRTASNVVWLNNILTNSSFEEKRVLIVLSKCDVPDGIRFNVIDELIGFDRVRNPARLSFIETSAVVGVGLSDVFRWVGELTL